MKTPHLIFLAAVALVSLPKAQAGTPIDESRAMPAEGLLQVENMSGSIDIMVWDKAEVQVSGDLGDGVEQLEIVESSSGLQVRVHNPKNQRNVDESHLRLQVPVSASIEAEGVSADISVKGSRGASLVLNSISGDLSIEASTGRLEAESVSGDVTFSGHAPRASIETVSGEIDVKGVEGEVRVSTVSGDAELVGKQVDRGRFETVSGDLEIELDVTDGGRLNAQSMSGDVRLTLPATQLAEFVAQTYSGDLHSDFGNASESSRGPGKSLSFREGSNGASIKLESFSGDITINRR